MRNSLKVVWLIVSIVSWQKKSYANPTECFSSDTTLDPTIDYFPHKVQPEHSEWWTIEYHNTYKIVTNLESVATFVLYNCVGGSSEEEQAPPPDEVLEAAQAINATALFSIPLTSVGVMMTPPITYLEQINMLDTVKYFLTLPEYISSPCFLDRVQAGFVTVPLPPGSDATTGSDDSTTTNLVEPTPNVTLNNTVAFGSSWDAATFFQTIVPVSEWMELTNAGIFEWVKYFSVFYNQEELANQVFNATQAQWNCVSQRAQETTADATPPVVLWAYYSDYCGGWDVGSCPNYYCEYASACGAAMVDPTSVNGSIVSSVCGGATYLSIEELVQLGSNADVWFFPAPYWNATYDTFFDPLQGMKAVQNQQVYDYQGSGEDAWFQERFAEYYDVLQDYCHVIGTYPTNTMRGDHWFRNVFTETVGDPGECDFNATPTLPFVFEGCDDDDENVDGSDAHDGPTNNATDETSAAVPMSWRSYNALCWGFAVVAMVWGSSWKM